MRPVRTAAAWVAGVALLSPALPQTPAPIASGDCALEGIETDIRAVNEACCVPASTCIDGAPNACNSQCAHVFLRFYNKCYGDLSAIIRGQLGVFDALAVKCQITAPDKSCLSDDHQKQVLQYLSCAEMAEDEVQRQVCVHRTRTVLGLQGETGSSPPEHCLTLDLDLPLLADTDDDSGNSRTGSTFGDAFIADGAHFDGSGDYISVPSFEYATDGTFSIGVWFTKESCTGGIYEYLFSHAKYIDPEFSVPTGTPSSPNPVPPNPNVHMYLGCQHNGGGWSELGGTILRLNMYDDADTAVMFDYPAWNAESFDAVTNVWIHSSLVADVSVVRYYVNGEPVADDQFGFFIGNAGQGIPIECRNNAACNQQTGQASLSHLNRNLGTITLQTEIFLGGRMDNNEDRHFKGKLAGLTIASTAFSDSEASCIFQANEALLPALPECPTMMAEMMMGGNFELDISFLSSDSDPGTNDASGKHHRVTDYGGDVTVTTTGATFDGDGDYIGIEDFDYESDGDFSISFWITKDDCKDEQPYEYLYSHVQNTEGDHTSIDDRQNSNINLYIGCEKDEDVIASSVDGTVVRFNLIDKDGTWVLFDYPLQSGGDFDSLTHTWIHICMTVTRHAVHVYTDGAKVEDSGFGFPTGTTCADMHIRPSCEQLTAPTSPYNCNTDMSVLTGNNPQYSGQHLADYCQSSCHQCTGTATGGTGGAVDSGMLNNAAYPYPSVLRTTLEDFDLRSQIYIGARSDLDPRRHFLGHFALLKVYSSPLNDAEAQCIFADGEQVLVDVGADGHRRLALTAGEEEEDEEQEEEVAAAAVELPAEDGGARRAPPIPSWLELGREPSMI